MALHYKGKKIADAGFVINLSDRLDRRHNVDSVLRELEFDGYEFFDGFRFFDDEWRRYGCTQTFLNIFETALNSGYESIVIFEDDVKKMNSCSIEQMDKIFQNWELGSENFDVIALGTRPLQGSKIIQKNDYFGKITNSVCAHAFYYKKDFIEYIYNNLKEFKNPESKHYKVYIDEFINDSCSHEIVYKTPNKLFNIGITIPMIFTQGKSYSDNELSDQNYDGWIEDSFWAALNEGKNITTENESESVDHSITDQTNTVESNKTNIKIQEELLNSFVEKIDDQSKNINVLIQKVEDLTNKIKNIEEKNSNYKMFDNQNTETNYIETRPFSILGHKLADAGFYINLEESADRRENVQKQIEKYKITNLNLVRAERDPWHQSSATKSHRKVFEIAKEQNLDVIAVFEDDFQIYDDVYIGEKNINKDLSSFLEEFSPHIENEDWDIMCLGFNGKKFTLPATKYFSVNYKSTGGWGYLIKKRAYEHILNNFDYGRDMLAIDDIIPHMNYCGFKSMTANVQIVHHATGFISTLAPQGPVNYDSWIQGNYYNSTWGVLSKFTTFDETLQELYNTTEKTRNRYVVIENYDGNFDNLIKCIRNDEKLKRSLIVVKSGNLSDELIRSQNYTFSVEIFDLIYWDKFIDIYKTTMPQNYEIINYLEMKN
jgi:GR25 family glycosyltransferase involved in LPS biosynthesis